MGRVRTFIAVEVGPAVRANAVAVQKALAKSGAGVKWVDPSAMHVTLAFLGELDERDLHAVCRAVAKVAAAAPPFRLAVEGVGAFPTPRRPKTIWAGITDGADDLRRLQAALEAPLVELGVYRKEERGYTPHLTLGRAKADADGQAVAAELPKFADWEGGEADVEDVRVFSSDLYPEGPVYTVLARAELSGRARRDD